MHGPGTLKFLGLYTVYDDTTNYKILNNDTAKYS